MTASILTILAALIPFLIWLWKRRVAREDSPEEKQREWMRQAEREIASDDAGSASVRVNDALAELRMRRAARDSSGSGSATDKS